MTITLRRARVLAIAFAIASFAALLALPARVAHAADQSCLQQCVAATVTPHGTFADFSITTTSSSGVPTVLQKLVAEIYEPNKPGTTKTQETFPMSTSWQPRFSALKPNTLYNWHVWAKDQAGNVKRVDGSFKTLRRRVDVTFQRIGILDDSDDLSQGDLSFWFNVNGTWDEVNTFEVDAPTGDNVFPNHSAMVMDAPNGLVLGVYGRDEDCFRCDDAFEAFGPEFAGGSNSSADWAGVGITANTNINGPGEAFVANVIFSTTQFALKFDVQVQYKVSYV